MYPVPLDRLNALDLDELEQPADVDYRALGLGPEDIPALVRIATDRRYDTVPLPLAWAPLHAWRALGALRAAEAAEPLTMLFDSVGDDDWMLGDLPRVFGQIGAPAIPIVARYLTQPEHAVWSRIAAGEALAEIGKVHPDVRDECVTILTDQLRHFETQDDELNAFLVSDLLELRAVESAPVIEAAFAADRVDLSVCGDWEDVQVELGLLPARLTPARRSFVWQFPQSERQAPTRHPARDRRAAEKRRRKLAKQSKRRNRRRR